MAMAGAALVAPLLALPAAQAADALPQGTYLSLDDARLADEGLIVPILEYIEIGRARGGGTSLETGYLHLLPDPVALLLNLAYTMNPQPAPLGILDLAGMRRIALRGAAEIGAERIAWTARDFAMTTHEPGRLAPLDAPRPSPFLVATAAADGGAAAPSLPFMLNGDVLTVTGPDGTTHRYRREPPMIARLVGFIGRDQDVSIVRHDECLRPLAAALADGRTYVFSHAARQAAQAAAAADGPAAQAAWQRVEEKGPGAALAAYLDATVAAQEEAGRFLHALIERDGLDAVLARFADPASALDPAERWALLLIEQFHYFGPEAGESAPAANDIASVLAPMRARYERDPWSVTGPAIQQMIDRDGWVAQVRRLLREEIARLCPGAANP